MSSMAPPGAPLRIEVMGWDQDFVALGVTRRSVNDADPTVYGDPTGAINRAQADHIVGPGWHVTIS
jgi:hypothetical protein